MSDVLHPDLLIPAERRIEFGRRRSASAPGRDRRMNGDHPDLRPGDRRGAAATAPNSPPERTDGRSPPPGRSPAPAMIPERPHDPADMAADERLRAVAEILAAGLLRLRAKRFPSRINHLGENSLDFGGAESVSRRAPRRRRGTR